MRMSDGITREALVLGSITNPRIREGPRVSGPTLVGARSITNSVLALDLGSIDEH